MYTLCFVAVVYGSVLGIGPANVAVRVQSDVFLKCRGEQLSWEEYVSKTNGGMTLISSGANLTEPDKYDLIMKPWRDGMLTYDLIIKRIQLKQGGTYNCQTTYELDIYSHRCVEVITLNGETLLLFYPCFYGGLYLGMYIC